MIELNSKQLVFIGDIHGDFQRLPKMMSPYSNTCFIVCGDCGFGFHDTKESKIVKMISANFQAGLEKRDNYLLFFRGNHDDPEYFESPTKDRINTSRFILLSDFEIIAVAGERVMCVGGAVSIDRRLRKTNSSYWLKEEISFTNHPIHDEFLTILATHSAPRQYVSPFIPRKDWIRISFQVDKKLTPDCDREDKLLIALHKNFPAPIWIHGHHHFSGERPIIGGKLVSLDINEVYEIRSATYYDKTEEL